LIFGAILTDFQPNFFWPYYFFKGVWGITSMANSTINFIGGVILGASLGVVTGLLAAPASGRQTRKKLRKKSRKFSKEAVRAVRQYLAGKNQYEDEVLERKLSH
jgi:hypothetical protein